VHFVQRYIDDPPVEAGQHIIPSASTSLVRLDATCDNHTWVVSNRNSLEGRLGRDIDWGHGYAAVAGQVFNDAPIAYDCSPSIPTTSPEDLWAWYLFTDQGEGVCGATLHVPDSYFLTDFGVAIDAAGLYFSSSWVGTGTVAAGTPHAFDIDTTTGDLLVYRYAW
jgi:hypothetical protein